MHNNAAIFDNEKVKPCDQGMRSVHVESLSCNGNRYSTNYTIVEKLEISDTVRLLSTEDRKDAQKSAIYTKIRGQVRTHRDPVTHYVRSIGLPWYLIARINMRHAKLRIIGTRVFCFERDVPSRKIVVFDIWNPMSVNRDAGHVRIEQTPAHQEQTHIKDKIKPGLNTFLSLSKSDFLSS